MKGLDYIHPETIDRPVFFHPDARPERCIHLKVDSPWTLKGRDTKTGLDVLISANEGEYTLEFKPHSHGLSLIIIDPDPGTGGPD